MNRLASLALLFVTAGCAGGDRHLREPLTHTYSVSDPQFLRTMGALCGPAIVGGNHVDAFHNGDEIFPAMLDAIRGAQHSLTFATYIYWSDEIGHEFATAFAERARAGVKVHILVDWVGSGRMNDDDIEVMVSAGAEFQKFNPLRWYNFNRLNHRMHSKILVADGRIGFTGGVGIAEQWTGDAQDPGHWRDSHFRVEGPVVAQLQAVFMDQWVETTGRVLDGEAYFPTLAPVGSQAAQVFSSSPAGGSDSMQMMYLLAINAAERSIHLSSAYFIPDDLAQEALVSALRRGVTVEIITPGEHMDVETARRASRANWGPLLEAGARILEYQPTMFHCKVLVVDELFVSVGSTNFDPRSFRLNDEANLNVYDAGLAARAIATFRRDAGLCRRIDLEAWRNRPWSERFVEGAASLLEALL